MSDLIIGFAVGVLACAAANAGLWLWLLVAVNKRADEYGEEE